MRYFSKAMLVASAALCLNLSAYSQDISLKINNVTVKEAMERVKKDTGYSFVFSSKDVNTSQRVSVSVSDASIEEVIKQILKGQQGLDYEIQGKKIVLRKAQPVSNNGNQEKKTVSGKVVDANGEPVIGATIMEKGTTNGTITDFDGNFNLNVVDGAQLEVSYVGFQSQNIKAIYGKSIAVTLKEDSELLDEVVVVGYGVQKKESLTASVTQIKSSEILTTKSTNLVSNLQGKVSGMQIRQQTGEPGNFSSMMSVRGFGTPLIVIDGIARDGTSEFERLNPEDIESISVLKDASAAIYGMNADNGVIIVTTKKGQSGDAKFTYSGFYGITSPTILQKSVDAYTAMLLRNEMDLNSKQPITYSDKEMLEKYRLGTEPGYQDYDWVGNSLKKATSQQQHNISVKGGSEKVNYYTSFGWVQNNGILKSDIQNYEKYTFRNNLGVKLFKGLTANVNVSGRYDKSKGPQGSFFWLMKPIMTADRRFSPFTINNPNHLTNLPGTDNPYALMTEEISGYDKWEEKQYQIDVDINYEAPFLKGLKFRLLGAIDGSIRNASKLKKTYYLYDYYNDTPTEPKGQPTYNNSNTIFSRKDFQAQVNYSNIFANKHNVSSTMVYEAKTTRTNYLYGQRQWDDVYTNDILDQGDLTNINNSGYRTETAFMSLLGRFNYDYLSKYLLEFAFRYDGSYRYAPGKRWGFFPSISAGWRISEEAFIKDNFSFIDNLKVRGSYGMIGADPENSEAFQYIGGYTVGDIDKGYVFNDNILTKAMLPEGVINDNLTWIKSKTLDIGFDLDLFGNKFSLSADYFQKDRTGLLGYRSVSVPNTFGATFPQENLNSDRVRGYDFIVTYRDKIGDFSFEVSANMTYSRLYKIHTERGEYGNSWEKWHDMNADGRIQGAMWGYKYDGVYTDIEQYETAPLYNGYWGSDKANSMNLPGSLRIIDVNGDGKINGNDQLPILWSGQINPPLQYGLTLKFAWKNFDFNTLLQGAALYTVQYACSDTWGYGTHAQITEKFLDRWHPVDPEADPFDPATEWISGKYPALKLGTKSGTTDEFATDMWNMNATYLRLKSIELGYNVPIEFCKRLHLDNLRLFFNAFNLYTFCNSDVKKFDPERHEGQYNADLTYPLMKSFNFGLTVNF